MTRTYVQFAGLAGLFSYTSHVRGRAREMLTGLEITPHNPANPANRSRHIGVGRGGSRDARTDARALPLGEVSAKKGPSGASTDPTTGNATTDRAGRNTGNHTIPNGGRANNPNAGISQRVAHPTHQVGAGSNISTKAEQPSDEAPARLSREMSNKVG